MKQVPTAWVSYCWGMRPGTSESPSIRSSSLILLESQSPPLCLDHDNEHHRGYISSDLPPIVCPVCDVLERSGRSHMTGPFSPPVSMGTEGGCNTSHPLADPHPSPTFVREVRERVMGCSPSLTRRKEGGGRRLPLTSISFY